MKQIVLSTSHAPMRYPCQGVPSTLQGYADGTAHLAIQLNPNPYSYPNNQNGLVLVGYAIQALSSSASVLQIPGPSHQMEHWHALTYTYGRQIPTHVSNQ